MGTPESNFWKTIRKNLPSKCFSTRIESRIANGIPDSHLAWDGLCFFLELKTTKNNTIRITPNQIGWNTAYCSRGGLSFILVKDTRQSDLYLFRGSQASEIADNGLRTKPLYFGKSLGEMFKTLRLCDFI